MEKLTSKINFEENPYFRHYKFKESCWFPPTRRTIKIINDYWSNYFVYFLPFPYIIFAAGEDNQGNYSDFFVLFANENPNKSKTKLYIPPLPNIYTPPGSVCLGGNKFNNMNNGVKLFWESKFTPYYDWVSSYKNLCNVFDPCSLNGELSNLKIIENSPKLLEKWASVKNSLEIQWQHPILVTA